MAILFPPLARSLSPELSPSSVLDVFVIGQIITWASFALLVFDWLSFLPLEYRTVWRARHELDSPSLPCGWTGETNVRWWRRWTRPGRRSMRGWFIASRRVELASPPFQSRRDG